MIVQTDKGKLEGVSQNDDVTVFRGVAFATAPVGALRWKAPQAVAAWSGIRKAQRFGKSCIQPGYEFIDGCEPVVEQSEDCLYLNVWTTGAGAGARKPVMVWIHGGAYKIGAGSATACDGSSLARRGAVVVTFNYRLGHLGFFAHPALEREHPGGPVNFGLLDQIAALSWVQRNIARFGGDPGNVTLFGASSGAASVLALFASPLATGLFHRAIAHSAYAIPEHSRDHAIALGQDVADRAFELGPTATAADLRALPAERFAVKYLDRPGGARGREPVPSLAPVAVIGDAVLPRGVRDTFEDGEEQALPLILGSNSNDASALAAFGLDPAKLLARITRDAGAATIETLQNLYREDSELQIPEDLDNAGRFGSLVLRDLLFTMQARWIAQQHSRRAPTRRYYFSYVPEALRGEQPYGVAHGGETMFAFDSCDVSVATRGKLTDHDRVMAQKVSGYWLSFAQTGTPAGAVAWPQHEWKPIAAVDKILKLGETIEVQSNFRRTRLEIFATHYPRLSAAIDCPSGRRGSS